MRDILSGLGFIVGFIIGAALLFMLLFFGVHKLSVLNDEKLWNNGNCDNCGGYWEYEQAVGHRSSTSYIYVCEKCGKRIEVDEIYDRK